MALISGKPFRSLVYSFTPMAQAKVTFGNGPEAMLLTDLPPSEF
jgi:hypothetical protein